jgi:hypothetical protein
MRRVGALTNGRIPLQGQDGFIDTESLQHLQRFDQIANPK